MKTLNATSVSPTSSTYHAVIRVRKLHEVNGNEGFLTIGVLCANAIADASDGVNQGLAVASGDLSSQVAHVHIHHVGGRVIVEVPDVLGDLGSGKNLIGMC